MKCKMCSKEIYCSASCAADDTQTDWSVKVPTVEEVAKAFIEQVDRALNHLEAPKTGMQVPYHDDFCNITPGTAKSLRWWKNRFQDALNS